MTKSESEVYVGRARKIVRDKLKNYYEAGDLMKKHLCKNAGVEKISQINKQQWEEMLGELEALADPNDVYQLLVFGR